MTPEERAEKIHGEIHFDHPEQDRCLKLIAAHIAEAEREAVENILERRYASYQDGFAAAKAKAAGVVREGMGTHMDGELCYECDCHGICPQTYYAAQIEALEP